MVAIRKLYVYESTLETNQLTLSTRVFIQLLVDLLNDEKNIKKIEKEDTLWVKK